MHGIFHNGLNPQVTRQRLRLSFNRVRQRRQLPLNFCPIRRRQYSVKAPLSMIHVDGHHKLNRCGVRSILRLEIYYKPLFSISVDIAMLYMEPSMAIQGSLSFLKHPTITGLQPSSPTSKPQCLITGYLFVLGILDLTLI